MGGIRRLNGIIMGINTNTIGSVEQVRLWDGLLSYWKLDETSGTVVADSFGGMTGTLVNGTLNNVGKNNTCWKSTSGTGKGITYGTSAYSFERTNAFTFNCWVKIDSTGVWHFLINKQSGTTPYPGYSFRISNNNKLYTAIYGVTSGQSIDLESTSDTISSGIWYMCTLTYNGNSAASGCKVYLNGVESAQTTISDDLNSSIIASTTNFAIGGRDANSLATIGSMDEVALWKRALRSDEVKALYSGGNGKFYGTSTSVWRNLASYWRFDENTGTSTLDKRNIINGTLSNASAWKTGKNGSGFGMTGGYYCNFGANYKYKLSQPYSISAWVKITSFTDQCNILSNYASIACSIDFFVQAGVVIFFTIENGGSTNRLRVVVDCTTGSTFQHYVVTYNGDGNANNVRVYQNGVSLPIQVLANTLSTTTPLGGDLTVNYRNAGAVNNTHIVDELGLWNRVLSAAEIKTIYNAGNGLFY